MTEAGIEAIATYVPPGRLSVAELRRHWPGVAGPGGVSTVAVAGFDEDVVTMAVEACDGALAAGGVGTAAVDLLVLATCSSPYAEHSAAAEVARALGLPSDAGLVDLAGSTVSGVTGLVVAADAVRSGRCRRALVVASERRTGRPGTAVEALGAGAAAALVSADGPVAIGRTASTRFGVPTRWRPDGERALHHYDDARYELMNQVVPAVTAVLADLREDRHAFLAVGPLDVRSRSLLVRAVDPGAEGSSFEVEGTGDLGAAGPLFALAGAVGGEVGTAGVCMAVEPGSGAVGLRVALGGAIPVRHSRPAEIPVDYVGYLQRFGAVEGPVPPSPIVPYAATPGALRDDGEGSLTGSRCTACGSLNVPPRRRCIDCGGTTHVPERAPRSGTIVTYNVQHVVAVHPEPSPVAVGVVRLTGEGGARGGQVSAMVCDSDLEHLGVGSPVELVYRRLGADDGLVKYGWKVRVVPETGGAAATQGAARGDARS